MGKNQTRNQRNNKIEDQNKVSDKKQDASSTARGSLVNNSLPGEAVLKKEIISKPCFTNVPSRILISFSNLDGSKHLFYSSSIRGETVVPHLSLPGCNKVTNNSPCKCYVSESINGLFCFYNGNDTYICNPSTNSITALPESSETQNSKPDSFFNVPYSTYSFGFDPSTNEYKVLHIHGIRQEASSVKLSNVQCEVFAMNGGLKKPKQEFSTSPVSWRKISHVPPYPYLFRGKGVCVNGSIYWMGMRAPGLEVVVVFDVGSEKFRLMSIPDGVSYKTSLAQIGGCLALLGYKDGEPNLLELWVLEDYVNLVWKKVSFVFLKNQKRVKTPILVGNACTGDFILTPTTVQHQYDLIACHGKIKGLVTIRLDGLPAWTDSFGAKNINFCLANHVESSVPLPEILHFGKFALLVDA